MPIDAFSMHSVLCINYVMNVNMRQDSGFSFVKISETWHGLHSGMRCFFLENFNFSHVLFVSNLDSTALLTFQG